MRFFASLRCNMSSQSHGCAPMPECVRPRGPTFLMYRIPRLSGPLIHCHPQSANSVARGILPWLKCYQTEKRSSGQTTVSRRFDGRGGKKGKGKSRNEACGILPCRHCIVTGQGGGGRVAAGGRLQQTWSHACPSACLAILQDMGQTEDERDEAQKNQHIEQLNLRSVSLGLQLSAIPQQRRTPQPGPFPHPPSLSFGRPTSVYGKGCEHGSSETGRCFPGHSRP